MYKYIKYVLCIIVYRHACVCVSERCAPGEIKMSIYVCVCVYIWRPLLRTRANLRIVDTPLPHCRHPPRHERKRKTKEYCSIYMYVRMHAYVDYIQMYM